MQQLEEWPIEKLIDYARNPRKNDHAVDAVAGAIREFGFKVPIVAKSDGTVVDGHLRPPCLGHATGIPRGAKPAGGCPIIRGECSPGASITYAPCSDVFHQ